MRKWECYQKMIMLSGNIDWWLFLLSMHFEHLFISDRYSWFVFSLCFVLFFFLSLLFMALTCSRCNWRFMVYSVNVTAERRIYLHESHHGKMKIKFKSTMEWMRNFQVSNCYRTFFVLQWEFKDTVVGIHFNERVNSKFPFIIIIT